MSLPTLQFQPLSPLGAPFCLQPGTTLQLGRANKALRLESERVSRQHAMLACSAGTGSGQQQQAPGLVVQVTAVGKKVYIQREAQQQAAQQQPQVATVDKGQTAQVKRARCHTRALQQQRVHCACIPPAPWVAACVQQPSAPCALLLTARTRAAAPAPSLLPPPPSLLPAAAAWRRAVPVERE